MSTMSEKDEQDYRDVLAHPPQVLEEYAAECLFIARRYQAEIDALRQQRDEADKCKGQLRRELAEQLARVRELEAALIQQAKLTGYYNDGLAYPSPNYPGKQAWWDYLTEEGRAALASPQRDT